MPCMVAVEADCEASRREGLMACLECVGRNQAELQSHHCLQPDLEAFCSNTTCVAKLSNACGLNSADLTCAECQTCQHAHAVETGCTPGEAAAFCEDACRDQVDCSLALESSCEDARQEGFLPCVQCTGVHLAELNAADCANDEISSFCQNQTCIAKLAGTCHAAAQNGCYECGQCAHGVKQTSDCGLEEDQTFCAQVSVETEPTPISCDEALSFFCSDARDEGLFKCVQCTGKHEDETAMKRAQCTDAAQISFCQNTTCYDVLDAQCGNEVSCSSCAECVENAVVPPNLECGIDQRKLYCDPVPNTILAIGGCDKPGECTTATGRMDVFGVLQEYWSNGTTLALPRAGAAAAKINGNLGFGPRVFITVRTADCRLTARHTASVDGYGLPYPS